ncbi:MULTISPECIES: hypothetical protein [Devosia]|uniref:hypothetical protein n=1 Tax=Devosia TaxID=46913 RepID=UPI000F7E980B|nr:MULTISPECIES: hypothetical protein [Devosia]
MTLSPKSISRSAGEEAGPGDVASTYKGKVYRPGVFVRTGNNPVDRYLEVLDCFLPSKMQNEKTA